MLFDLLAYIQAEKWVNEQQLTRAFQISPDALQPMLNRWVKKGVIRKVTPEVGCQKTCAHCEVAPVTYYQAL